MNLFETNGDVVVCTKNESLGTETIVLLGFLPELTRSFSDEI